VTNVRAGGLFEEGILPNLLVIYEEGILPNLLVI
jgi:hypothetical protein